MLRFSAMLIYVRREAVFCFDIWPISSFAACRLTRQEAKRAGGPFWWEVMMQRRLGLDLEVSDQFGYWLAGFTAGEGCFYAGIAHTRGYKYLRLSYSISLRTDDRPGLEYIQETLGIGKLYNVKQSGGNPHGLASYTVHRIADLYHVIVPLFEKYPILPCFKKARDFQIWKELVEIHYLQGGKQGPGIFLPQAYWDKVEPLVEQLKAARQYQALRAPITVRSRSASEHHFRRRAP